MTNGGHLTKITQVVILSHGEKIKGGGIKISSGLYLIFISSQVQDTVFIVRGEVYCNFVVLISHFAQSLESTFLR